MITDFHTHAFPDSLAPYAIRTLEAETNDVKAKLDGTVSSLLASMDRAGVARSVVCSIATKPEQFPRILEWSGAIASARLVALPSVHPADPQAVERIGRIAAAGFKGVKLHPYYQGFNVDDGRVFPLYERMAELGLILVCHTGFDIAFPRILRATPRQTIKVVEGVPALKLVATHLGAWEDWDEVQRHILGKPIYMEISFSLEMLPPDRARFLIENHPPEYLLFGTDSPWQDQAAALALVRGLKIEPAREKALLEGNAARLLGE
jgi:predicted TIM-barrel fold metal-dependent hydrolase